MTQEIEIKVAGRRAGDPLPARRQEERLHRPDVQRHVGGAGCAENNDAIAVTVFIGSGGVFSAGNDINDFLRRAAAVSQRRRQGHPGARRSISSAACPR